MLQKKLTLEKARADTEQLVGMQLTVLPMTGIQDVKWAMLIPVEYHKGWFYFATPPLLETCKKVKAN